MIFAYAPKLFLRVIRPKNGGFEGTDIDIMPDKIGVSSPNGVASINTADLVKVMRFKPYTTIIDDGKAKVSYWITAGTVFFDVYLKGGYSTYSSSVQLPADILPKSSAYYPLATQSGNNTAKVWLDAYNGSDRRVYIYNYDVGYCTGSFPIAPSPLFT